MSIARPLRFACALLLVAGCGDAPPNVLLISLDTTRADRLGAYGYERPTSPHLDRLAGDSVRFTRAYSNSSWTLPTHASLLTGRFPSSHGARYDVAGPLDLNDAIAGPDSWVQYRARGLGSEETTLAALLSDAGYATGAVVAGPWLKRVFGLDLGFRDYDDDIAADVLKRPGSEVSDRAIAWLERAAPVPFFLFLHYFDAHDPFEPPPEFERRFLPEPVPPELRTQPEVQSALYDAEIAAMDVQIGRVLDFLRSEGLYDETVIVVTADHGELLGEFQRFGHGITLTEPEIRVPLLVKHVGQALAGTTSDLLVQSADVLPILFEMLGRDVPPSVQGRTLSQIEASPDRFVVAEVYPPEFVQINGDWQTIIDDEYKFMRNSQGAKMLFHLAKDPGERRNVRKRRLSRAAAMEARLDAFLASLPAPGPAGPAGEIDAGTREALEGLGYLESERD